MNSKILVAEDDRKTVEIIKLYLERDGYQVLAAHDRALPPPAAEVAGVATSGD